MIRRRGGLWPDRDVAPPKNTQPDVLVGEEGKVDEAARSQMEEVRRVEQLGKEFAAKVPELEFYHIL